MGEGFVVMQSNDVDIYYYQDEPGMLMHAHARSRTYTYTLLGNCLFLEMAFRIVYNWDILYFAIEQHSSLHSLLNDMSMSMG